jgi:hypothetical protein
MTASRGLRKTVHKPMTYTPPPPLYVIGQPGVAEVKGKHSYGSYPQAVKAAAGSSVLSIGWMRRRNPTAVAKLTMATPPAPDRKGK